VAGTDYTVNTLSDGSGRDVTDFDYITISTAIVGGEIEVTFANSISRTLYVCGFQIRGTPIIERNQEDYVATDADAVSDYGKRVKSVVLPLASDRRLAEAIGNYVLNDSKTPTPRIDKLSFGNVEEVAGTSLWDLEIFDTVTLSDTQLGLDTARFLIIGFNAQANVGGASSITLTTRQMPYDIWILEDATYGVLENVRLGI